jgi:hypothetical protein
VENTPKNESQTMRDYAHRLERVSSRWAVVAAGVAGLASVDLANGHAVKGGIEVAVSGVYVNIARLRRDAAERSFRAAEHWRVDRN